MPAADVDRPRSGFGSLSHIQIRIIATAPSPQSTASVTTFTVSSRKKAAVKHGGEERRPARARQPQHILRRRLDRRRDDGLAPAGRRCRADTSGRPRRSSRGPAGPTAARGWSRAGCCAGRRGGWAAIPACRRSRRCRRVATGSGRRLRIRSTRKTSDAGGEHEGADGRDQVQHVPAEHVRIGVDAPRHADRGR